MRLPHLIKGVFLRRLNRFVGQVEVEGKGELVHIANTGRLERLLLPGNPSYLLPIQGKLKYRLFAIEDAGDFVVVDSFIGEKLLEEMWESGREFPYIGRIRRWKKAPSFRGIRLDYFVEGENGVFLVEQKSSTLLEGEVAYFPDAPTDRGFRQLLALFEAESSGFIPMLIMVIKHPRARFFSFAHHIDERFSKLADDFVKKYPFLKLKLRLEEGKLWLSPF
ncbi:DNA/RNA nuclease SfsA [bacterium]|nr:DNA/RNA nuclease SfsA [bacterium]